MILFQVDPQRIASFPLERDAPRTVDVNTVPFGRPLKAMEVEPRHVQVSQDLRLIQGVQAPQTAFLQILPYPAAAATLEQVSQSFVLEASDHSSSVTLRATMSTIMLQAISEGEHDRVQVLIASRISLCPPGPVKPSPAPGRTGGAGQNGLN